jgi:hypothetical protein
MTDWTHDWTLITEATYAGKVRTRAKQGRATTKQRASLGMWRALNDHQSGAISGRTTDFKVVTRMIEGPDQEGFAECQVCGVYQKLTKSGVIISHACVGDMGTGGTGHLPFGQSASAFPDVINDMELAIASAEAKRADVDAELVPIQLNSHSNFGREEVTRESYTDWLNGTLNKQKFSTVGEMNVRTRLRWDTFDEPKNRELAIRDSRIDTLKARLETFQQRLAQSE